MYSLTTHTLSKQCEYLRHRTVITPRENGNCFITDKNSCLFTYYVEVRDNM